MGQIEDLKLFVSIVENASISKAADRLGIAKSAVSRRLKLLEGKYAAELVHRKPGQWQISDAGKDLYQRSLSIIDSLDTLDGDFSQTPHKVEGPLSVTVAHEFGLSVLNKFLIEFQKSHREIQLNVVFDNRPIDLNHENYDFALRVTPNVIGNEFTRLLARSRYRLFASEAYLAREGIPGCVADLKNHRLLSYGAAKQGVWSFKDPQGNKTQLKFRPAMSSNSGSYLFDAMASGAGIARLPDFVVPAQDDWKGVVEILKDVPVETLNIYLMRSENRRLNRRMRLFADELEKFCSC